MTGNETPRPPAASSFRADFCDPARRRLVLAAAILASALGFIDGTIVAIALPAIRESLGASLSDAQWINNAYMLPLSALILAGGALGDRFGLSRAFMAGIALFILASLASAAAPDADVLIAARALKGAGAALMVPGSLALIHRAYPPDERGAAIGTWAAASALTTALGPVLGGLVISWAGPEAWRWLFAINLPLGLVALWLVRRAVREDRGDPARGIDWQGALLASAALGLAAWTLTALGPGTGPSPLAGGGAAAALLLAFLAWEARSPAPMMPLGLFADRAFATANAATFLLYFALSAILFFLPMTVIAGWGVTEGAASLAFVPLTAFIAAFSNRAGRLATRRGAALPIALGCALVAVAFAGLALTAPLRAYWGAVLPLMCLMGAGMALVVAPLSAAVMAAAPDRSAGAASGINNALSRIAGLVAVAAMGSLAASVYAASGGPASFGAPAAVPGHAAAGDAAFSAIAWVTAALAAGAACLAALGLRGTARSG